MSTHDGSGVTSAGNRAASPRTLSTLDRPLQWSLLVIGGVACASVGLVLLALRSGVERDVALIGGIVAAVVLYMAFDGLWRAALPGRAPAHEVLLDAEALHVRGWRDWRRIPLASIRRVDALVPPASSLPCVRVSWREPGTTGAHVDFLPVGSGDADAARAARQCLLDAVALRRGGIDPATAADPLPSATPLPPTVRTDGQALGETGESVAVPGRESIGQRQRATEDLATSPAVEPLRLSASSNLERLLLPIEFTLLAFALAATVGVLLGRLDAALVLFAGVSIGEYMIGRRYRKRTVREVHLAGDVLSFVEGGRRQRLPLSRILEIRPRYGTPGAIAFRRCRVDYTDATGATRTLYFVPAKFVPAKRVAEVGASRREPAGVLVDAFQALRRGQG